MLQFKKMKTLENKLTSKQYIFKYVIFKILFEKYPINSFLPSESKMADYFNTTNLTIRSAYNNLISLEIIKPIKGKGYKVIKEPISFFWPLYDLVSTLTNKINSIDNNMEVIFYDKEKIIIESIWNIDFESYKLCEDDSMLGWIKVFFRETEDEIVFSKNIDIELINNTLFYIENLVFTKKDNEDKFMSIKTKISKENLQIKNINKKYIF